jgi:hypothetical protein
MAPTHAKTFIFLIIVIALLSAVGCKEPPPPTLTPTATLTRTATITPTPTITLTPTPTQTTTPAFTITPLPSNTLTVTPTPYRTLSPTPTPSQVPLQPAELFPFADIGGKTVDWSYIHVTQIDYNRLDEVNDLWAFVGFQLMDRAIHQRNFQFLGDTITVYYLHVAHEFDGEMIPMQLILGGTPGADVAINDIPAGGTAYLQVQIREAWQPFDPYIVHRDANRAFELRSNDYPLLFLKEFQSILPTLPEQVILLADHPILIPPDDWPQIKLDMGRVSYFAARYHPFFEIDAYDRLIDQSDFAYALRDHILLGQEIPVGLYAYSSNTLIIITGNE